MLDVVGIDGMILESLICACIWLAVYAHNNAVEQSLQRCGGRPLESVSCNPPVRPRTPRIEWEKLAPGHLCTHPGNGDTNLTTAISQLLCSIRLFVFFFHLSSRAPAGRAAAAVRCQSWWWATSGICSGSASCPAGRCRSWWRRRGSAATWSALQNSTGTSCCSSKSCWASPWRGACARTTPPSVCRGLYRGTAAPSCDPESSLRPAHPQEWRKRTSYLNDWKYTLWPPA